MSTPPASARHQKDDPHPRHVCSSSRGGRELLPCAGDDFLFASIRYSAGPGVRPVKVWSPSILFARRDGIAFAESASLQRSLLDRLAAPSRIRRSNIWPANCLGIVLITEADRCAFAVPCPAHRGRGNQREAVIRWSQRRAGRRSPYSNNRRRSGGRMSSHAQDSPGTRCPGMVSRRFLATCTAKARRGAQGPLVAYSSIDSPRYVSPSSEQAEHPVSTGKPAFGAASSSGNWYPDGVARWRAGQIVPGRSAGRGAQRMDVEQQAWWVTSSGAGDSRGIHQRFFVTRLILSPPVTILGIAGTSQNCLVCGKHLPPVTTQALGFQRPSGNGRNGCSAVRLLGGAEGHRPVIFAWRTSQKWMMPDVRLGQRQAGVHQHQRLTDRSEPNQYPEITVWKP